jgi:lipid-binding SYLF domain-containing protein
MKALLNTLLVTALLIASGTLFAASVGDNIYNDDESAKKANKTLHKSVIAMDNIMDDPDNSIPPSLIDQSEGIVIFPDAFKIAFGVVGGQGARGIALVRQENGSWSNPFFVSLGEGSFGLQLGAQKTDIVLLFKDRDAIMDLGKTEITLGGDVGVTAGPVSKGSSATTDIKFDSEIYSYSSSKGLFAGVSFKGGVLTYNESVNETLYGIEDINTDYIFHEVETPYNHRINDLIEVIEIYGNEN